jgi:lipid II:glycine glycyltransferase (peptidoglycan interpeptide bridge formation enzyme)
VPTRSLLETDDAAWDAFVAGSATPTHLQTTAWAEVKRSNGWRSVRVAVGEGDYPIGAQMLVQRPRGSPWALGYIPRGPVGAGAEEGVQAAVWVALLTERLRVEARQARIATIRLEPEVEAEHGLEDALIRAGWRRIDHVQPETTRMLDLSPPEEALWSGLRSSARWSVNRSRRSGIRVVEADGSRLGDFHRIHAAAMARAGVLPRAPRTYDEMWAVLAPRGMARLLFAEDAAGEPLATLFLVSCGARNVDLYSGTTPEGDRTRANYLLKWEALLRSRAWGFTEYDLWGLPNPGIAEFKASFGGREIRYVGGWELAVSRVGHAALVAAESLRERYVAFRYRRPRQRGGDAGA